MKFSLFQNVQTASGAHTVFYSIGDGSSFPENKEVRAWGLPLVKI